ncbi:hypothetical protein HN51_026410 [Arachis hypogaea]
MHGVVALIGVGGSILGVKFLDPLAGLLVSGMILKAGAETGYQSYVQTSNLINMFLLIDYQYLGIGGCCNPSEHLNPIKPRILQVDGFKGCHRLRGRRAGSYLYLDVHIEILQCHVFLPAQQINKKILGVKTRNMMSVEA